MNEKLYDFQPFEFLNQYKRSCNSPTLLAYAKANRKHVFQVRCLFEGVSGTHIADGIGFTEPEVGSILVVQSLSKHFLSKLSYIILMTLLLVRSVPAGADMVENCSIALYHRHNINYYVYTCTCVYLTPLHTDDPVASEICTCWGRDMVEDCSIALYHRYNINYYVYTCTCVYLTPLHTDDPVTSEICTCWGRHMLENCSIALYHRHNINTV